MVRNLLLSRTTDTREMAVSYAAAETAAVNGLLQTVVSEGPEAAEAVRSMIAIRR